ncbi:MAG: hypothetical protein ACRDJV_02485 [Actinomycetota bacterium]
MEWRRVYVGIDDCPRCHGAALDAAWYAYLFGLYLGDGCLAEHARGVFRLRIVLDERYLGIISECATAIGSVRPSKRDRVTFTQNLGCIEVSAFWKHWPYLFPQHGRGPKHTRVIKLRAWQQQIVHQYPDRLLRGLIHSDGWRGDNIVKGKPYPRYQFTNASSDIRKIFCDACDRFGVRWRRMNERNISIARAPDVAKLDCVVGRKM